MKERMQEYHSRPNKGMEPYDTMKHHLQIRAQQFPPKR